MKFNTLTFKILCQILFLFIPKAIFGSSVVILLLQLLVGVVVFFKQFSQWLLNCYLHLIQERKASHRYRLCEQLQLYKLNIDVRRNTSSCSAPHADAAPLLKTVFMNFISWTVLSLFLRFTTWKSYPILQIIFTDSYLAEWQKNLVPSSTPLISSPILTLWISGREISSKVYFSSHMGRSWKRLCGSTGKPSNMTLALASQPHPNGHQHTVSQGSAKQARKQIQLGICWTEACFCEKVILFA